MRLVLMGVTLAITAAAAIPAKAQTSFVQSPAYSGSAYPRLPLPATTPEDAYRDGLISRWQMEQLAGPLPPALQGPPVNGNRGGGGDSGGGRQ